MKDLAGRVVVVTGAASGIGRATALRLAEARSELVLIDIDSKGLARVNGELEDRPGGPVHTFECDLTSAPEIERCAAAVLAAVGDVDVLINNAGVAPGRWISESRYDELRKTIDINLIAPIWMTRQFLPRMIERERGHIVNIASAMGLQAVPRMSDYVASKFGLVGFSDSLRLELAHHRNRGIAVTVVCPAGIDTGMFEGYAPPPLTPLLKPEYVAERIVCAIQKEEHYLMLPAVVRVIPLIRTLPTWLGDFLARLLGLSRSMDHLLR